MYDEASLCHTFPGGMAPGAAIRFLDHNLSCSLPKAQLHFSSPTHMNQSLHWSMQRRKKKVGAEENFASSRTMYTEVEAKRW